MKSLIRLQGVAAPLALSNVDTDVIIRIEKLGRCPREELGQWAFEPLRYLDGGLENPGFVLNQEAWRHAPILVTGANFGCGSSREHAVWALQGIGVRCVIAPSFGDIFRSNCFQNGMLPIQLAPEQARWLLDELVTRRSQGKSVSLIVDLERRMLTWPGQREWSIAIDDRRRLALMEGLDEVGTTLKLRSQIDKWQAQDRVERAWKWGSLQPSP